MSFDAAKNFHFLVTDAEVDPDSRAAAHGELKANELCRWINDLRDSAENSGLDEVIATYRAELALSSGDLTDNTGTEHDSVNWQTLYEQGRQRLEALKKQYKSSKPEAECICQPDLECKHRECQAELFDVQDRVDILEAAIKQAREEALSWKNEAMQPKGELARREVQYGEQVQTSKKEMLDTIKDYRDKVDDSKRWNKDGLTTKYEKLEGEQVVLVQELERIKRDNADKNDGIKKLLQRHQED